MPVGKCLPPAVLWVDPGLDTGLALLQNGSQPPPGNSWWCDEFRFMEAGTYVESICQHYRGELAVGWESFDIRPRTPPVDAHHAIEMIGVIRRISTRSCCQLLTPAKQEQRKTATRGMLTQLGWWVKGKDDAQSAAQHLLAWMLRENIAPPYVMAAVQEARK
jgi:hypothetical protein